MTEMYTLAAEERVRTGKGGAREARRNGKVPCVVYGSDTAPRSIAIDGIALQRHLKSAGFMSHVFTLDIAGKTERVLPRDVQHDPVSGATLHIDFLRVSETTELTLEVEVAFINQDKCPGIKRGGVLNVVTHTVEIACTPDRIPEQITVDCSGMEIGDVVHASDLKLPAGVRLEDTEVGATIATIAAPTSEAAVEEEGEETAAAETKGG